MCPDSRSQLAYYYGGRLPMQLMGVRLDALDFRRRRHRCAVCGGISFQVLGPEWKYNEPDMYEKQLGIDKVRRYWSWCHRCQMKYQVGALNDDLAQKLYTDGYRSVKMRQRSVHDEFHRIVQEGQSENVYRVDWILRHINPRSMLDVGSGLGLFPYEMKRRNPEITIQCFEPNNDSFIFIQADLGLRCVNDFYRPWVTKGMFDLVSLVHVLEHITNPTEFMSWVNMDCARWVYIEVPDVKEFDYLEPHHDEFNSTHHWFWSSSHLIRFLEKCKFEVSSLQTVTTERGLSRIMVLAKRWVPCLKMAS